VPLLAFFCERERELQPWGVEGETRGGDKGPGIKYRRAYKGRKADQYWEDDVQGAGADPGLRAERRTRGTNKAGAFAHMWLNVGSRFEPLEAGPGETVRGRGRCQRKATDQSGR